jgi:hypothetical protein
MRAPRARSSRRSPKRRLTGAQSLVRATIPRDYPIYEGANQVQRVVMARQLLKG